MRDQFKVTTPYDVTQTSCFYRAIGSEIFRGRSWNGVDTLALRKAVSIYIEQAVMSGNDEYIQNWLAVEGGNKSLDVHLGEIERGGYANSIAIYVMSQLIQRPIHIFYFSNKATNLKISITRTLVDEAGWIIPTQIVGGEFDADPIRLLLINNVHFHVMTYIH